MKWIHTNMHTYVQTVFSLTHPKERVWPGEPQPMLIPESSCVCIPSFRILAPRVCFAKAQILAFFTRHKHRKWCGHIDILKMFPIPDVYGFVGITIKFQVHWDRDSLASTAHCAEIA